MAKPYESDEMFGQAADAWAAVLCAEDAGEHADEEEKLMRHLSQAAAGKYGASEREVLKAVKREGMAR